MKKKILILAGGYSKEREISLLTAKSVFRELKKTKKYRLKIADPSFGFVSFLKKYKPNVVFNALHGQFGEDGYCKYTRVYKSKIYSLLRMSSFMAMDKEISKKFS